MNHAVKIRAIAIFLLSFASHAANAVDVDALRTELREANAANDGARIAAVAGELLEAFNGHPSYLYYAARGAALSGNAPQALEFITDIVSRGTHPPGAVATDPAFTAIRTLPVYAAFEQQAASLHQPAGTATTRWSFGPVDTQPEGVTVNSGGCVYIGSVRRGEIIVHDIDGKLQYWPVPGRWSVQGLHLSPDGKQLWAATSAMNVSEHANESDRGRSALLAFDVVTGKVLAQHEFPASGEHVLGDFIFLDDTTLLATDSIGGGVHALDIASGIFTARVAPGTLRSPQGLARFGTHVVIADYSNGLYRFDPQTNALARIADGPASPYGIDGLYVHDGALLAIHNGVRPYQVNRYQLSDDAARIISRETLLANHPAMGEPTLGVVAGDELHFVANSLWNHVTQEGNLPASAHAAPVILSLELSRISRNEN